MKTQPPVINFNFLSELFMVSYLSDIDLGAFLCLAPPDSFLFFFLPIFLSLFFPFLGGSHHS